MDIELFIQELQVPDFGTYSNCGTAVHPLPHIRVPFEESLFSTHACGGGNMLCQESGSCFPPIN